MSIHEDLGREQLFDGGLSSIFDTYVNSKTLDSANIGEGIKKCKDVNIIIDMKTIFSRFLRDYDSGITLAEVDRPFEFSRVACRILNIIAHYKNYVYKRTKKDSTVYLLYSKNYCDELIELVPDYKSDIYSKLLTDNYGVGLLHDAYRGAELIGVGYPNVKFLDTTFYDEHLFTKAIIDSNPNAYNLILSTDPMFYNLFKPNVCVMNGMGSFTSFKHYDTLWEDLKITGIDFKKSFIRLIMAFTGVSKLNIDGVSGIKYKKASAIISKCINEGIIHDVDYETFPFSLEVLEAIENKQSHHKLLIENFELLSKNFGLMTMNKLYDENIDYLKSEIIIPKIITSPANLQQINESCFIKFGHTLELEKILRNQLL